MLLLRNLAEGDAPAGDYNEVMGAILNGTVADQATNVVISSLA